MAVLNFHSLQPRRIPPGAVYIGRVNSRLGLPQSPFANPFVIKGVRNADSRAEVIEKYRQWLWQKIRKDEFTIDDLVALDGKNLVCYCAPMACHGHVLEKAVKWAVDRKAALEKGLPVDPIPGISKPAPPRSVATLTAASNPDTQFPRPQLTSGRPPKMR